MSNADWAARDKDVCWHPYTQHGIEAETLPVVGAKGSWLELEGGGRMLDAISSWWCCLHGHGHPRLVEAIVEQARTLDHVLFAGCTHEPAVRLAEGLVRVAPEGLSRVFYSDNGSTTVEVALKAAYQRCVLRGAPERTTFIALDGSYHGDTFGAMAVGDPDPFFLAYRPLLFDVVRIAPNEAALAAAVDQVGATLAAVILEPAVQGAAGMRPVSDDFLRAARGACDASGAMLIADEVLTGFGRTGSVFACTRAGVTPDALCLSKGLTGGMLPLAATLFTEAVFETFLSDDRSRMFFHGHTFTGNPIACALACASLEVLEAEDTPARLDRIGRRIEAALADLSGADGIELRRIGGITALELRAEDGGYLSELSPRLRTAAREQSPDVLLRPLGNVLYAMPPASTSEAECDLIAARMRTVVETAIGRQPAP